MSAGRLRTMASTTVATITKIVAPNAAKANRHPSCAMSSAVSGAITRPPKPMPVNAMPIARPRFLLNQFEIKV